MKQDAAQSAATADPHEGSPVGSVQVAALYVDARGPYPKISGVDCWDETRDARLYAGPWPVVAHPPCGPWGFGLPGVDPWDEVRDARNYAGPHPVVAHPPCERWGRYWSGGPSGKVRRELGDDGGCFSSALASVRNWGGVLEHPEASHAFKVHALIRPRWRDSWKPAGDGLGFVCCVAQGNYGHRARKLTWLYAVAPVLPELNWSIPVPRSRLDYGFHSAAERREKRATVAPIVNATRLDTRENLSTPVAFRDVLIGIARLAQVSGIKNGASAT